MAEFLHDSWRLYFHDAENENWEFESYVPLATLSTVDDVADAQRALRALWAHGHFFLMREHILPLWEDEHNKRGGCLSYKVMRQEVPQAWFELMARVVGETVLAQPEAAGANGKEAWEGVCGISLSPKRNFSVLRLWVADPSMQDVGLYTLNTPAYTKVMYRSYGEPDDKM